MTAFDTDVLSLVWLNKDPYASRAFTIPAIERGIPVAAAEEILRGRLDQIRKAEAGKSKLNLSAAYDLFQFTLIALRGGVYLPFTDAAAARVTSWKAAKIRVRPMDMRIAAIAIEAGATLVTRNARDFKHISGLKLDIWT